ncbi:MAG: methyltransferase domain-containing protein [Candidatus Taylorbacteria bacterium]
MNETSKSKRLWLKGSIEELALKGKGIDIGPANDPVLPNVRTFDMQDGDANNISRYIHDQFDFVYASHCLEHMIEPQEVLKDWWKLVKTGGYIFFAVPDEDLYEQGVFPSRFNPDHKATFTISKSKSWSNASINVLDMAQSLPNSKIMKLSLQDDGYDYNLYTHGPRHKPNIITSIIIKTYHWLIKKSVKPRLLRPFILRYEAIDQTMNPNILAQIVCIIKKIS